MNAERTMKRNTNGNGMNVRLLYRGLNPREFWQNLVEKHVRELQNLAAIASATITLESCAQSGAGFRVRALLEVPGPDFHAEASDYTLRAALIKVVNNLRRQIKLRRRRQLDRHKDKGRHGSIGNTNIARL
jgi:ribosome-associated translation inhibitor RaiA